MGDLGITSTITILDYEWTPSIEPINDLAQSLSDNKDVPGDKYLELNT